MTGKQNQKSTKRSQSPLSRISSSNQQNHNINIIQTTTERMTNINDKVKQDVIESLQRGKENSRLTALAPVSTVL